jgi:hypothetical protein
MNLTVEKEKIKREIDLIDDARILKAIRQILAGYEAGEDTPVYMINEPPIEDWEMATPEGRTPTPKQLDEWLDKGEGELTAGEEAFARMHKDLNKWRENPGKNEFGNK